MKKLLLIASVFLFFGNAVKAQDTCAKITVTDTLHYYFNKYYFKTGQTTYSNYPYYKSAAATVTNVTHIGSMFENADNTMTVTGLQAYAFKLQTSANTKIPLRLFLCNLNSNNMPIFPPVDSVSTEVNASHVEKPGIVGGPLIGGPKVMSGNYAVLIRNLSVVSGDTVCFLRTAGLTNTYVATPSGWTSANKYSDDKHAYVRFLGTFYNTKDFTQAPGFGVGTEYEFMVAPCVQYTVQAGHQMSQNLIDFRDSATPNDTTSWECARTSVFTFTNRSSYHFTNPFYNLNEFYRKWNLYYPFSAQPVAGGWSADSSITWNFEYKENEHPQGDGRIFLKYGLAANNQTITSTTGLGGCWDNAFRASLRPMSAFGRQPQIQCSVPFKICLQWCDDDYFGIEENQLSKIRIAPNPLNEGVASIRNLEGKNQIVVTDLLGQKILVQNTDAAETSLDLSTQASGTYFVEISNDKRQSRTIKIVR